MADQKRRDQITANRAASAGANTLADAAASNALDSVERQEEILNPQPVVAKVGGKEVDVYPLAFKDVRKLRALMTLVFAEATGEGPIFSRLSGTLGLNDKLRDQFVQIVARSMFPAEAGIDRLLNLASVAAEIDEKADFNELAGLMLVMAEKNPFTSAASPK